MFKKGNNIFSLLIVILSVFMTSSSNIVQAADSDPDPSTGTNWGDSLITKGQLQDDTGKQLTNFYQNQSMRAYWEFSNQQDGVNKEIHKGDTLVVKVPQQLALTNISTPEANIYEPGDNTNPIGIASIDPNQRTVTVTFTQKAEDDSKGGGLLKGSFWIDHISWDANIDISHEVNLQWTTSGSASPGSGSTGSITIKPSIPNSDEKLYKYGGFTGNNTIHWTVRINYAGNAIPNAVYKDIIGLNQKLVPGTMVAHYADFDKATGQMTEDKDSFEVTPAINQDETEFSVNLGNINRSVILEYDTNITDDSKSSYYGNTGDLLSNSKVIENVPVNLSTNKLGGQAVTNGAVTSIRGYKLWNIPAGMEKPESVTIQVFPKDITDPSPNQIQTKTVSEDKTTGDWYYEFNNLPKYDDNGKEISYDVKELDANGFTAVRKDPTNYNLTNIPTPNKNQFTVTKKWNDGKDQNDPSHPCIEVRVFTIIDGKTLSPSEYSGSTNTDNDKYDFINPNWTHTFKDLPTLPDTARWYVSEYNIPDNYISTDSYNYDNNYDKVVTNTLATKFSVKKVWLDSKGQPTTPNAQSIKVQFYQSVTKDGKEVKTPIGPTKDNGPVTITPTEGIWSKDLEIPTSDSTEADPKTTTKLPAYDSDSNKITYSAEEVASSIPNGYDSKPSYSTKDNVETITNKQTDTTKPTTSFTVNKAWAGDDNNSKKTRPDSIKVQLYADGVAVNGDKVDLDADHSWTYKWDNLPKNNDDGKEITYSAEEVDPENLTNYTVSYPENRNDKTQETITNTYNTPTTPTNDKTKFTVTKIWNDNDNSKNTRPTSVQIQLLANGVASGSPIELDAAKNNSKYTWNDLDKNNKDGEITYTVKELDVPNGYSSDISIKDNSSATITNTLKTPGSGGNTGSTTTNVNVTKTWSDSNNKDNLRPSQVTIHLSKDGKEVDSAVLNADNNWAHNFTGLDKNSTYTVSEDAVSGYTTNIDSIDSTDVQITNTHTPSTTTTTDDKTNLTVNKRWNDSNNKDNLRPSQVTVHLLKNGSAIGQAVQLSSLNAWSYTWNNLDKNGNYSVQEDAVSGYTASQSTNNNVITITNTHTPKTPGNPDNPGNPFTPDNPGGNNGNNGGNGGTGDQVNTGNGGGGSNTTTDFTPGNPMVPSVPYQKTNTSNGLLPQTGSKDANILYSILGVLILGFISIFELKRKRA